MSKRKVPSNEELKRLYEVEGLNSSQISKMCGAARGTVCRALKNAGVKMRKATMENHGRWKGGKIYNKGDGYIGIYKPDHPRADNVGYVYEHTLVIEKHLGRLPQKGEVVHHINGDKHDNRIENLYLCNHKEHKTAHWSLEKHLKYFLENDIIEFRDGKYELKEIASR